MANLITEKQHKSLRLEYQIRLGAMALLIIALLGVIFLAYVIPYYISVKKNDLVVSEQFKSVISIENKENTSESATWVVTKTLDELKAVDLYGKNTLVPSESFAKVIGHKNQNIRITRLNFSLNKAGQGQILVNGIAKNRDGLVTFVEDLKAKGGYTSVESPISDLAKDSNITFTVSLKINL
jgi:hypothetical protein